MNKADFALGGLYHADCREVLQELPSESVDSVVTDPPAGIAFMAAEWDDPSAWKYPISQHGFTDGGDRVPAPGIASSRNPNCRKCKRHKRGWKDVPGCECEEPDFDDKEHRLRDRAVFVGWLTQIMSECLRILKPGGHALVWSLPRTSHWTATALEEAGFEIRDSILHCFGQGFPKSLNIGKAIDKLQGAERTEVLGSYVARGYSEVSPSKDGRNQWAAGRVIDKPTEIKAPATPEAAQWEGWGTALKPAVEIWWLCRKPLKEKTVAEQVLSTGTGGINIDGSRVLTTIEDREAMLRMSQGFVGRKWAEPYMANYGYEGSMPTKTLSVPHSAGRWPANLVLSHSPGCVKVGTKKVKGSGTSTTFHDSYEGESNTKFLRGVSHRGNQHADDDGTETVEAWECVEGCPVKALDEQSGDRPVSGTAALGRSHSGSSQGYGGGWGHEDRSLPADTGGASRFFHNFEPEYAPFFYTGKITSSERKKDLEDEAFVNKHPTTKSIKLMSFLVKLVTPSGGTVLDPFAGSGSTLVAAAQEGFKFIGVEREVEYFEIAKNRRSQRDRRSEPTKPL